MQSAPVRAVKIASLWLAKTLGLFALSRRMTRKGLRILCYHGIWLGPGHFADYLFMSPGKFRRRMEFLATSHYPVLSLDNAVRGLSTGTLPDCATVITIDDGWFGTYQHMMPILNQLRLPASLYVSSYYVVRQLPVFDVALQYVLAKAPRRELDLGKLGIDSCPPVNLDVKREKDEALTRIVNVAAALNGHAAFELLIRIAELLEMGLTDCIEQRVFHLMTGDELQRFSSLGLDVQLHTHRHRLSVGNEQDLAKELEDNRQHLRQWTERPLHHFCYPSGVWSEACWPILQSAGIDSATTTLQGLNFPGEHPLRLKRLLDGESVHQLEFEAELCGLFELKRRLLRTLRPRSGTSAATG